MTVAEVTALVTEHYVALAVSIFAFFAIVETFAPMRALREKLTFRWFNNLAMMALVILLFKLLGPILALASAFAAERWGLGMLNRFELPFIATLLAGILLLDLKQYLFHRAMHHFDLLWRIHRVHHSDVEIDLTSGFRFHPFEVVLSAAFEIVVVVAFGIPPEVILLRQLLTFSANFFTHSNLNLPPSIDAGMKKLFVTPSFHHLHHALEQRAANHNYGVIFSFWDRLFCTYLAHHPVAGDGEYAYGLREYRDGGKLNLWVLLAMPMDRTEQGNTEPVSGK